VNDLNDVSLGGGGIYCKNASPAIINCTINDNFAYGSGGGIACEDSDAVIMDCNIIDNICWSTKIHQVGGGIHCDGGSPGIYNCTIKENISRESGGGIAIRESDVLIDNSAIIDNFCVASGGGIFSKGIDSNSISIITNCLIAKNVGYWSGGVSSIRRSFVEIENCTIANNAASWDDRPYFSGGLHCFADGTANVTNSIIWGNTGWQIVVDDVDANSVVTVTYSDIQMFDSNGIIDPGAVWSGVRRARSEVNGIQLPVSG